jgi:hypothetical protein
MNLQLFDDVRRETQRDVSDPEVDQILPAKTISVRYHEHIGIVLDGFDKFNLAWFAFTAIPNEENLNKVIKEFEILVADPRKVVVVPMDLEQPYVGSVAGEKIWRIFKMKQNYVLPFMIISVILVSGCILPGDGLASSGDRVASFLAFPGLFHSFPAGEEREN